jgi:hypothetical protein
MPKDKSKKGKKAKKTAPPEGPALDTDLGDLEDLLPEAKGAAKPLQRTAKQTQAAIARAEREAHEADLRAVHDAKAAEAAQLAQIVNLFIGGYSFLDIALAVGATENEIENILATQTQRYVRNQASLRTYVRNFVSGKYTALLDAVWDEATDKTHPDKLENQDRAIKILDRMAKLHGAPAPTQSEVKMETAPEDVDRLVAAISKAQGLGYDVDVFDTEEVFEVVETEVGQDGVHRAVGSSLAALEASSLAVEQVQPQDGEAF